MDDDRIITRLENKIVKLECEARRLKSENHSLKWSQSVDRHKIEQQAETISRMKWEALIKKWRND